MATTRLDIVTAERVVFSEDVDVVVAPGVEGQLGILPHHAPLMTMLMPGELRVRKGWGGVFPGHFRGLS
jgi:F-type H+-transporting ATPase subunit epsilon